MKISQLVVFGALSQLVKFRATSTKTSSIFRRGGNAIYLVASIPKTAYRMHLRPLPFNSAPQTLPDMKCRVLGELPL